jgi:hypothetical protein
MSRQEIERPQRSIGVFHGRLLQVRFCNPRPRRNLRIPSIMCVFNFARRREISDTSPCCLGGRPSSANCEVPAVYSWKTADIGSASQRSTPNLAPTSVLQDQPMTKFVRFQVAMLALIGAASPASASLCTHLVARVQAQVDAAVDRREGFDSWKNVQMRHHEGKPKLDQSH